MNTPAHLQLRWTVAIAAAIVLVAAGAIATYILVRPGSPPARAARPTTPGSSSQPSTPAPATAGDTLPDVTIDLTEDAVRRAGIVVTAVESRPLVTTLRLPAVVEPNAYKQVAVTPLVSGRITRVLADLGTRVRQGQTLATVFSPELVEAQTRFVAASAELEAHERELARTEKLVQIGSASQQELERIHAEHTSQRTNVASARSRLELLGMSKPAVDGLSSVETVTANTDVPAPIAGIVTERGANVGLNVDTSAKLFTIVDLSTVWIVANLYERDFSRVQVGNRATIGSSAYPELKLQGTVSYIDPQVSPETRTTKLRIEVPNPRQEFRLGMLAEVRVEATERTAVTLVPKNAVQNVGDRSFVYIPKSDSPTQFIEREVRLGAPSGADVQVVSGLTPGDRVVAGGSFFLRAERERLGLRPAIGRAPTTGSSQSSSVETSGTAARSTATSGSGRCLSGAEEGAHDAAVDPREDGSSRRPAS